MCAQRERQREREGERDWEICYWCCRCDNVWATISLHWPARTDSTKRGSRRGRGLYSNIQPCVAHTHAHVQVSSWLCMCVCSFDAPLWPINKLLLLLLLRPFFCVCQLWAKWIFLFLLLHGVFFLVEWLAGRLPLENCQSKNQLSATWPLSGPGRGKGCEAREEQVLIWLGQWMSV